MTEEPVFIDIDASQLEALRLQLDMVMTKTTQLTGGKSLDKTLPRLNRELRMILGQIPGMRQALAYYTRAERMERGIKLGGTEMYLALITTAIVLIKEMEAHKKRVEQERRDLEMRIRKSREWTHDEYVRGQREWTEYAKGMPG